MGAVVGAALAAGSSYDDVVTTALGVTRRDVAALSPIGAASGLFARSILRARPLKAAIGRLVPARSFAEMTIPFTVTAVDLDTGALTLFGAGGRDDVALTDALYASCALPVYYPPLVVGDRRYGDGGLRATLPLQPLRGTDADLVVAVDVGPTFVPDATAPPARTPPLLRAHDAAVRILLAQQIEYEIERWNREESARLAVVRPVQERHTTFAIDRIPYYVERGYRAGRRVVGPETS